VCRPSGNDYVARIQMDGIDSGLPEAGGDNQAGKAFPEAGSRVGKLRCERAAFRDFAQHHREFVEEPANGAAERNRLRSPRNRRRFRKVKLPELRQSPRRLMRIARCAQ
jgi:hypothetical protein